MCARMSHKKDHLKFCLDGFTPKHDEFRVSPTAIELDEWNLFLTTANLDWSETVFY